MKTIKNLDAQLKVLDDGDPIVQQQQSNQPTFRKMYRLILAAGKGTPEQAVESLDVSLKLKEAKDHVELSDSEYALLKDRIRQNPTGLMDHFWGQLLKSIE